MRNRITGIPLLRYCIGLPSIQDCRRNVYLDQRYFFRRAVFGFLEIYNVGRVAGLKVLECQILFLNGNHIGFLGERIYNKNE